jgi:hypothetical protein
VGHEHDETTVVRTERSDGDLFDAWHEQVSIQPKLHLDKEGLERTTIRAGHKRDDYLKERDEALTFLYLNTHIHNFGI